MNLGNCRTPHFLGEPTPDRKAFMQIPHEELPQGLCRDWKAIDPDAAKLMMYLSSCDRCGAANADNLVCDKCFSKTALEEFGGEAPTIENGGLGSGIIPTCTRPLPHVCRLNGPCNGWPKPPCSGCGATEGTNHNYDCPEAQD